MRNCDGVVCGHIHKAEIREIDGLIYCNDGDWVESLSALVETTEGELKLVFWKTILGDPAPNIANAEQHHLEVAVSKSHEEALA
jgi:hypothetical protein